MVPKGTWSSDLALSQQGVSALIIASNMALCSTGLSHLVSCGNSEMSALLALVSVLESNVGFGHRYTYMCEVDRLTSPLRMEFLDEKPRYLYPSELENNYHVWTETLVYCDKSTVSIVPDRLHVLRI